MNSETGSRGFSFRTEPSGRPSATCSPSRRWSGRRAPPYSGTAGWTGPTSSRALSTAGREGRNADRGGRRTPSGACGVDRRPEVLVLAEVKVGEERPIDQRADSVDQVRVPGRLVDDEGEVAQQVGEETAIVGADDRAGVLAQAIEAGNRIGPHERRALFVGTAERSARHDQSPAAPQDERQIVAVHLARGAHCRKGGLAGARGSIEEVGAVRSDDTGAVQEESAGVDRQPGDGAPEKVLQGPRRRVGLARRERDLPFASPEVDPGRESIGDRAKDP